MKIVLHACCGPCSTVPLSDYLEEGHEVCIYFANSNIHPESEYLRRRDTIARFAEEIGVEFVEGPYSINRWMDAIGECRGYGVERCSRCYRLRFEETAEFAEGRGADAMATSLTISPYQFADAINVELIKAAEGHGLAALTADYRQRYSESVQRSRDAGMYRQNYCGCMYSLVEAQEQRNEARAARKAAKVAKRAARGADNAD